MHYDGAGPKGWLACLATSRDLTHWTKKGPVLDLGAPGSDDSASASYGTTYWDGTTWHMFYLGTPHASHAPDRIPSPPYLTMKARSDSPSGPWVKEPNVVPFRPSDMNAANYGASSIVVASPGMIVKSGDEYLMFFSWGGYSAKTGHDPMAPKQRPSAPSQCRPQSLKNRPPSKRRRWRKENHLSGSPKKIRPEENARPTRPKVHAQTGQIRPISDWPPQFFRPRRQNVALLASLSRHSIWIGVR